MTVLQALRRKSEHVTASDRSNACEPLARLLAVVNEARLIPGSLLVIHY